VLKLEGAKYNIKTNVLIPVAASRLTEDVLPPDLFAKLKTGINLSSDTLPVFRAV